MKPVNVGLLGLGTVGGGTVSVLTSNAREIMRRAGRGIHIAHAAARAYDPERISGLDQVERISDDAFAVVEDPRIDIVIELIGGFSPAKELVLAAIENGKHVVTANKALIALHGNEIFAAARKRRVVVAFEAAVAGGIPIIKALREGLAANHVEWIAGIINGTSNYILTQMRDKGRAFAGVLAEAQSLGYAEANPSFDVDGVDAAHKLCILGSLAFGIPLQFDRVYREGIAEIDTQDVAYAADLGYCVKHLGITRKTEQGIEMRVHPTLIRKSRLIANVNGVMNAVLVKGDAVGPTLYYGAGAGAMPTASAVVADLVDITRVLTTDPDSRVPHLAFQPDELSDMPVLDMDEVVTGFYLRVTAQDQPGVMAKIAGILGEEGISIAALQQREAEEGKTHVPLIVLSRRVREGRMNRAIARIEALDSVSNKVVRMRLENLAG